MRGFILVVALLLDPAAVPLLLAATHRGADEQRTARRVEPTHPPHFHRHLTPEIVCETRPPTDREFGVAELHASIPKS